MAVRTLPRQTSGTHRSLRPPVTGVRNRPLRPKPAEVGAEGRLAMASPSTRRADLRNAKRKPAARGRGGRK